MQGTWTEVRRELKYVVPRAHLARLRTALAPWCAPDDHAGPDGTYLVRSLYLDDPNDGCLQAHLRQDAVRDKVRARVYGDTPDTVWLERKARVVDVVRKARVPVPVVAWPGVIGRLVHDDPAVDRWLAWVVRRQLAPVRLTACRREAWTSAVGPRVRVTLDHALTGGRAEAVDLLADARAWPPLDHGERTGPHAGCVVEIKVDERPPGWVRDLVARLELRRVGFSKFVASHDDDLLRPRRVAVGA